MTIRFSAVSALTATLLLAGAHAAIASGEPMSAEIVTGEARIVLADARSYRHCHNVHHRVYCHKSGRLPMNSPPLSGTERKDSRPPAADCKGSLRS